MLDISNPHLRNYGFEVRISKHLPQKVFDFMNIEIYRTLFALLFSKPFIICFFVCKHLPNKVFEHQNHCKLLCTFAAIYFFSTYTLIITNGIGCFLKT